MMVALTSRVQFGARQRTNLVVTKAAPRARQSEQPAQWALPAAPTGPTLVVAGVTHRPIGLAAIQPGDIGFQYKSHFKTFTQHCISLSQLFFNAHALADHGNHFVLHTFIILRVNTAANTLLVADASGGYADKAVGQILMDFSYKTRDAHLDPRAATLVYRLGDVALRAEMVRISGSWTTGGYENFSTPHAVLATLRPHRLHHPGALAQIMRLGCYDSFPRAMPKPGGGFYALMCSELVSSVGAAATVKLYRQDHHFATLTKEQTQLAVTKGRSQKMFAVDPRAVLPCALHRRITRDPTTRVVGYIPSALPLRH